MAKTPPVSGAAQGLDAAPDRNPRATLAAQLAASVSTLVAAGDLAGARVASDALSRLLGSAGGHKAVAVADLAEHRRRGR